MLIRQKQFLENQKRPSCTQWSTTLSRAHLGRRGQRTRSWSTTSCHALAVGFGQQPKQGRWSCSWWFVPIPQHDLGLRLHDGTCIPVRPQRTGPLRYEAYTSSFPHRNKPVGRRQDNPGAEVLPRGAPSPQET